MATRLTDDDRTPGEFETLFSKDADALTADGLIVAVEMLLRTVGYLADRNLEQITVIRAMRKKLLQLEARNGHASGH